MKEGADVTAEPTRNTRLPPLECAKAPNNDTREFLPTAAEIRAKAK